jgi:putative flippase GtrA
MTASFEFDREGGLSRPGLVGRLLRCMGVSVITTVISVTTLVVATTRFGIAATEANVLATAIATIPSYHLNRRWTWGRRDQSDLWREVVPFWVLSFCGLALSTVTVGIADAWASARHLTPAVHTATILVGHLGGFGVLWILQFVLLDRVLFATTSATTRTTS